MKIKNYFQGAFFLKKHKKQFLMWDILCFFSDSTKTVKLLAVDFYEVIVVSASFLSTIYHLIEISNSFVNSILLPFNTRKEW